MQFSVLQENLAAALNGVIKNIDARPILPILANVRLEAADSILHITASNIKSTTTMLIGAKVDQPGVITLPAKTLSDLVAKFPKERIDMTLEVTTKTMTLKCGSTVSTIKGISADDYPSIKKSYHRTEVVMPGYELVKAIREVIIAAAKEDARPALHGVFFRVKKSVQGSTLTLAAADGYRLSIREVALEGTYDSFEMIVPLDVMKFLPGLIDSKEPVTIVPAGMAGGSPASTNMATFRQGSRMEVSAQVVEARFPDFEAIVPKKYSTSFNATTSDFLQKTNIVNIFAQDDSYSGRLMVSMDGEVKITGRSAERGGADNDLSGALGEGDEVDMHFDTRFLIDILGAVDTENVTFQCRGADSPGVFRPMGREDFTYVLMPMTR